MAEITKQKILRSFAWNALEKYSSQGVTFLVSIIMARLLAPSEYGILGIASVFISFSSIFINSGLSNALICRKECSKIDYSTANWINITVSLICYLILFVSAPYISDIYELPILTPAIRVLTITLVIGAVSGVGRTILLKEMKFNQMSIITLATSIFSGVIGILMAYLGMGVWALIYQSVLSALFSSIWILYSSAFFPSFRFSKDSCRDLFSFGSKILGSDIVWVIFNNIYPLIIGKGFNAQSVGYFTRANSYSGLVPSNFSGVLETVLFPSFSNIKDDRERIKHLYVKAITLSTTVIFMGNFMLMGLSYPLVLNMISAKWLPCVPLLQILCLSTLVSPIDSINNRLLMALGYPGVFLKVQAVTKPISLIIIFISIYFGLTGMAWGQVIIAFSSSIYLCIVFRKYTGIDPFKALAQSLKILVIAGLVGLVALIAFHYWIDASLINLLVAIPVLLFFNLIGLKWFAPGILCDIKNIRKS